MPMVKAGNRICQPITQANCRRDSRTGSRSMVGLLSPSASSYWPPESKRMRRAYPTQPSARQRNVPRAARVCVRTTELLLPAFTVGCASFIAVLADGMQELSCPSLLDAYGVYRYLWHRMRSKRVSSRRCVSAVERPTLVAWDPPPIG